MPPTFRRPGTPAAPVKKAVAKSPAKLRTVKSDDDGQDEESTPRPAKAAAGAKKAAFTLPSGFSGYRKQKAASGSWAPTFEFTNEQQLVKFLDDEPVASWREHWIERAGKKSWFCFGTVDEDCPICDVSGDRPRTQSAWNVLLLDPNGQHQLVVLRAGMRFTEQLADFNSDPRTGPLSGKDRYWTLVRTGKRQNSQSNARPIKGRDILEEFGVTPLTEVEVKEWATKRYDQEQIAQPSSRQQIDEVAAELAEGE